MTCNPASAGASISISTAPCRDAPTTRNRLAVALKEQASESPGARATGARAGECPGVERTANIDRSKGIAVGAQAGSRPLVKAQRTRHDRDRETKRPSRPPGSPLLAVPTRRVRGSIPARTDRRTNGGTDTFHHGCRGSETDRPRNSLPRPSDTARDARETHLRGSRDSIGRSRAGLRPNVPAPRRANLPPRSRCRAPEVAVSDAAARALAVNVTA